MELLPCAVGEVLESSSTIQGALPSWTSCQPCGQDQLGLWRDTRPLLHSDGAFGNASTSVDDLQAAIARSVDQVLSRTGGRASSTTSDSADAPVCRICPPAAQCPGGAVVVPQPGWWHSAANSTKMHRCPYAPACGKVPTGEQSSLWQERQREYVMQQQRTTATTVDAIVPITAIGGDARSSALAWCQAHWYASGWHPGAAVVASAPGLARGLPASAAASGKASVEATDPTQTITINGTAAASPCLLWLDESLTPGLDPAAFAAVSYTQLQCAPSYTGILCAACQPGYYSGSRFQCSSCPSVHRVAWLAVLAFLGGLVVVSVTAYLTLYNDYTAAAAESTAGAEELLKVRGSI